MRTLIACLPALLCANPVTAQEQVPVRTAADEPGAPLARMAGDWDTRATFWTWKDPTAPPMECTATVSAQLIMGGRFLFQNVRGRCGNQPIEAIGVIGYDSATGRYQAASFDNMGTSISLHTGEENDAGDIVLHLSYQESSTGATVERQTVRTMISEREWVETAHETRKRDKRKVMEITARRIDGPADKPR
jgi:hypothetical protein